MTIFETPMDAGDLARALVAAAALAGRELDVEVEVDHGDNVVAVLLVQPPAFGGAGARVVLSDSMPPALSVASDVRAAWRVEEGRLLVLRRPEAPAPTETWEEATLP